MLLKTLDFYIKICIIYLSLKERNYKLNHKQILKEMKQLMEVFSQTVELECWELIVLFAIIGCIAILTYCICSAIVPKGVVKVLLTICVIYYACAVIYYLILREIFSFPPKTIVDHIIFFVVSVLTIVTSWVVIAKSKKANK